MRLKSVLILAMLSGMAAKGQNSAGMPSGNIGIGSGATAPAVPLRVHNIYTTANTIGSIQEIARFTGDVGNAAQFSFLLRRHTTGSTPGGGWDNVSSRLQYITDVTNQGYLEFNPQGEPHGLAIGSGATEVMRLKQTGDVGIGTVNPTNRLHILGTNNFPLKIESSDAFSGFVLKSATASKQFWLHYGTDGTSGLGTNNLRFARLNAATGWESNPVLFDMDAPDASLLVAENGNVGIGGTFNPEEKLHVNGLTLAQGFIAKNNPQGDNVFQTMQGTNWYHLIGTYQGWDPKAVYITAYNAGNNASFAAEKLFIGNNTTGDKYMSVNLMNGKVGIGTNNINDGDYRLYVEKGIRTRKVKVDISTWADHVFEPDYRLLTLQQVETFIKDHKHLPEMPSAKEVEKNGVDLGENQTLLLKKIEELTLYIIEQNKRIEALEKQAVKEN